MISSSRVLKYKKRNKNENINWVEVKKENYKYLIKKERVV